MTNWRDKGKELLEQGLGLSETEIQLRKEFKELGNQPIYNILNGIKRRMIKPKEESKGGVVKTIQKPKRVKKGNLLSIFKSNLTLKQGNNQKHSKQLTK